MSEDAVNAFEIGAGFTLNSLNIWLAILAIALISLWLVWALYGLLKQYTSKEINIYQFSIWGFGTLGLVVFMYFILI